MAINNFPLTWPTGWKRTREESRNSGRFNKKETRYNSDRTSSWKHSQFLTVFDGVKRVLETLEKMGVYRDDVVISTNVRTRLDGLPRSNEKEPDDPGAAVYWKDGDKAPMRCMAVDRYTNVADNLAAIAATLEAMRAIERHGGAEILDRAFTGFTALPEKASTPWRSVLGFEDNRIIGVTEVEARFRELAKKHHPDAGGDRNMFEALVAAREQAAWELTN